jgi:hypothetical protein
LGKLLSTILVTALYGDFEPVKPLRPDHGFDDAVCFTDNPNLIAEGWRIVVVPSNEHPRLAAKAPKMMPFDFLNADIAVWIDAAFQVVSPEFRRFCQESLGDNDFIVWEHPDLWHRNDLYQEANYCQDWPKYNQWPIRDQTAHYKAEGMPEGFGLWACGAIVWRNNNQAQRFGQAWYQENVRWSIQDQVSFPYLVWKLEPTFGVFPAKEFDNPYLRWEKHPKDD